MQGFGKPLRLAICRGFATISSAPGFFLGIIGSSQ
jgi:hypothetical protein